MTRLEAIGELIEDLTGATEPDRALDVRMALLSGWKVEGGMITLEQLIQTSGMPWVLQKADVRDNLLFDLPRFTASYDAAFSLAKADDCRRIEVGSNKPGDCWAYMHLDTDHAQESEACASEPIALCVAWLMIEAEKLADAE